MTIKLEYHLNWNVTQIECALNLNVTQIEMSLKLEYYSIWNIYA